MQHIWQVTTEHGCVSVIHKCVLIKIRFWYGRKWIFLLLYYEKFRLLLSFVIFNMFVSHFSPDKLSLNYSISSSYNVILVTLNLSCEEKDFILNSISKDLQNVSKDKDIFFAVRKHGPDGIFQRICNIVKEKQCLILWQVTTDHGCLTVTHSAVKIRFWYEKTFIYYKKISSSF